MKILILSFFMFYNLSSIFAQNNEIKKDINLNIENNLKDLVKQEHFLDDKFDYIKSKNGKLNKQEIFNLIFSFKISQEKIKDIIKQNKENFSHMKSSLENAKYLKTMLIYSNRIDIKTRKLFTYLSSLDKKNKLKDSPNSIKNKKGKNLSKILVEKDNLSKLKKEVLVLLRNSKELKATTKWLYVVSK